MVQGSREGLAAEKKVAGGMKLTGSGDSKKGWPVGVESVFLGSGRMWSLGEGWVGAWTECRWPQQVLELSPRGMGGSGIWQQDVGLI